MEFDPSHNPLQDPHFRDVLRAVHGPSAAKCLTMRCLDRCSSNLFCCVLVPDTTKSSPCLHTDMSTALEWYRQRGIGARVVSHRRHVILTRNIEALCGVLPSTRGFVRNYIATLALVVVTLQIDHGIATCRAVEMRSSDVAESQKFPFGRCSPVASHASADHELETLQSLRCRKRTARDFWCQLAQLGCVSQDSDVLVSQGGKSLGNPMQKVLEPMQRARFTKSTLRQASIWEKKGHSLGKIQVKKLYQRSPHALKI